LAEIGHTPSLDADMRAALRFDASDPPSIWSLKVRAAVSCGWFDEARASLRSIAAADLAKLPCDRDALGTLGHLARSALALNENDYVAALYTRLARYRDGFAVGVAFFCEGSVQQLLGMLAPAQARGQVLAHCEAGIVANDTGGFPLRAIEARLQLARYLANEGSPSAHRRAASLAREAAASASRLELAPRQREAGELLARVHA
jgi:hypothetical protein